MRMGQCDELLCDDCDAKSRDDVWRDEIALALDDVVSMCVAAVCYVEV